MLPRKRRLERARFDGVRAGQKASSPSFSLSATFSDKTGCAAVVSKAVAKSAVGRHLLKRRMLSVMKEWCKDGRSFIVYAKGPAAKLPFPALKIELAGLLSRTLR